MSKRKEALRKLLPARKSRCRLKLYIAGLSGKSMTALANLKKLCVERLGGNCEIQIVDLLKRPGLARIDQIVALPAVVRVGRRPVRRVVGDLSNTKRVLDGLALTPVVGIYCDDEHKNTEQTEQKGG